MNATLDRVDAIAAEIGRLRWRVHADPQLGQLVYVFDRLADHLETLDVMLQPSASELYRDLVAYCGDEQLALDEALVAVDRRKRELRRLLAPGSRA